MVEKILLKNSVIFSRSIFAWNMNDTARIVFILLRFEEYLYYYMEPVFSNIFHIKTFNGMTIIDSRYVKLENQWVCITKFYDKLLESTVLSIRFITFELALISIFLNKLKYLFSDMWAHWVSQTFCLANTMRMQNKTTNK